jgi:hypothetical protein
MGTPEMRTTVDERKGLEREADAVLLRLEVRFGAQGRVLESALVGRLREYLVGGDAEKYSEEVAETLATERVPA